MGLIEGLTHEVDIYAFGISCSEILSQGGLPWGPLLDDDTVRRFVCGQYRSLDCRTRTVLLAQMTRDDPPSLEYLYCRGLFWALSR